VLLIVDILEVAVLMFLRCSCTLYNCDEGWWEYVKGTPLATVLINEHN